MPDKLDEIAHSLYDEIVRHDLRAVTGENDIPGAAISSVAMGRIRRALLRVREEERRRAVRVTEFELVDPCSKMALDWDDRSPRGPIEHQIAAYLSRALDPEKEAKGE